MANTQDIRRRIKSIRNTAQITKAMQMVAASKMRKAQQHALAGRPYAGLMNKVLVSLQKRTDPKLHPLLQVRPIKKELVLIISTDKGLAGALNTNLFRETAAFEPEKTAYVVSGRKARQFIARTKRELLAQQCLHQGGSSAKRPSSPRPSPPPAATGAKRGESEGGEGEFLRRKRWYCRCARKLPGQESALVCLLGWFKLAR